MKTLAEQLDCLQRELEKRKRIYPGLVDSNRLDAKRAKHEIDCMQASVRTLQKMVWLDDVSREMKAPAYRDNGE